MMKNKEFCVCIQGVVELVCKKKVTSIVKTYILHVIHIEICTCMYLLGVQIIQMILHKLYSCSKVRLVELVWNVPAYGTKLPSLLHGGMKESDSVERRLPLGHVTNVQLILSDQTVCTLQPSLHTL